MRDIISKLSVKYNIPEKAVEQMINDTWKGIKTEIGSYKGKDIMIAGFGNFYIDEHRVQKTIDDLNLYIQRNETSFKNGRKRWISYLYAWKYLNIKLKKFLELKETIEKRKNRQKGERGL